ncbi:NUDIX hydrolase [Chloroflexota bacterium]
MRKQLKNILSSYPKRRLKDDSRVPAAVLVPVFKKGGEYHIVLTRRTNLVSTHKGQISFPGGSYEHEDRSLAETALRETEEEIGLSRQDITLLGELDDVPSRTSNFLISPYVGCFSWPYEFRLSEEETQAVVEVPIRELLEQDSQAQSFKIADGTEVSPAYNYQGHVIWGATVRILNNFLELWQKANDEARSTYNGTLAQQDVSL